MTDHDQDTDIETDDDDDETQLGGSKTPYTTREKNTLRGIGFTDDQIRYLNNIKKDYGPESLNVAGILYILNENNNAITPDLYTASYDKDRYPIYGDTDNEEETDDDTQLGGRKQTRRKRESRPRYSTKRETRRRRKSIKRKQVVRKKTRKFK